jgi:branched-chain amino acid transport system substrate-binding protein
MIGAPRRARRLWLVGVLAIAALAAVVGTATAGKSAASDAIRVAILSDCEGAFGAFYEADIGGAQAAFAQYAGGKPKNKNKPSAGMTGITIGGKAVNIVGYGCGNDRADKAIAETRRLMERLDADILVGPLSGDEGIAVANYAKRHPNQTFINGTSGAQDTTLKVRAKNFFRFNSDGAQWSAGLGDYAFNTLKWKTAAVISDDYSFAWTSAAGMIAEFCAVGGQITERVFPPLNTTDYSSYVQQLPRDVDGYFWAVGGAGLTPSLKAYEQAHGPIQGNKFIGNIFWSDPLQYKELGDRVAGSVAAGPTAGDSTTAKAKAYRNVIKKWYPSIAALESSVFVYNYYNAGWALVNALKAVNGDISGGQKKLQAALAKVTLDSGYGKISLDANRNAITDNYVQQLVKKGDGLGVKTIRRIPNVSQAFGGTFSPRTPNPDRSNPKCTKRQLPWVGKYQTVNFGG